MKKRFFVRPNCPAVPEGYNRGEAFEWRIAFEINGVPQGRNNIKGETQGDVNGWQVKTPKASLIEKDNCKGYIFGFADSDYYYEMNNAEFAAFRSLFSYLDYDIKSKSKAKKWRVKNDTKKMRDYLEGKAKA